MAAFRVCPVPGCPTMTLSGRCIKHAREADRARGTRQQRGYDAEHQRKRRISAAMVAAGRGQCWRCGLPIAPGEAFDLGHDDHDRTKYRGPEHPYCNRSAGGRSAHE